MEYCWNCLKGTSPGGVSTELCEACIPIVAKAEKDATKTTNEFWRNSTTGVDFTENLTIEKLIEANNILKSQKKFPRYVKMTKEYYKSLEKSVDFVKSSEPSIASLFMGLSIRISDDLQDRDFEFVYYD